MTTGLIFDIKRYAINDGPGIRTAVFMKGCPLRCWWCHNPEGQSTKTQLMYRSNRCKATQACLQACPRGALAWQDGLVIDRQTCDVCGKCAEACYAGALEMVGREITVEGLMAEIERDIPFYDQSGGGVTFTGGEPLLQVEFLRQALQACKERSIHTTLDTSGYGSWTNLSSLLPLVDLFLYDVKLMDAAQHEKYTSVPNGLILENLHELSAQGAHILVRMPLIPGINDGEENLRQFSSYLSSLPQLEGVELMPYHDIGKAKYQSLRMHYSLGNISPPTNEQIHQAEQLILSYDLPVIQQPMERSV